MGFLVASRQAPGRIEATEHDIARHDPALCLMPGLFRYATDADQAARVSLIAKQEHRKHTVELHNSCVLSGNDLAVLQAVVALASSSAEPAQINAARPRNDVERELTDTLSATLPGAALSDTPTLTGSVLHVDFSVTNLLEMIGWPVGGPYRKLLSDCLLRLSTCVVVVYPTGQRSRARVSHLLASVVQDGHSKKWCRTHVALYPRLTEIVLGALLLTSRDTHTAISQKEARKLGTNQAARILHQRLCGDVNHGQRRIRRVRTLLTYLFPPDESARALAACAAADQGVSATDPRELERMRRLKMKVLEGALSALADAGWFVGATAQLPAEEVKHLPLAAPDSDETLAALAKFDRYVAGIKAAAAKDPLETRITFKRPDLRF